MSLIDKTRRGIYVTFASRGFAEIIYFSFSIILARNLTPRDFGSYAFCLLVVGIVRQFAFNGIAAGIALKKNVKDEEIGVMYCASLVLGITLYFAVTFGMNLLFKFPLDFDLAPLTPFIGWIVFCETATVVPQRLMQRHFAFGEIASIRLIGTAAAGIISVTLSFYDYGLYSLVCGRYVQSLIEVVCFTIRPRALLFLSFKMKGTYKLFTFGGWVWIKQSCNYVTGNSDYFFIQLASGSDALGLYERAYRLVMLPMKRISRHIANVANVALSKRQDDFEAVGQATRQLFSAISIIQYPIIFGIFATAPELIPFLFGSQWTESVIFAQILCFVGLARSLIVFVEIVPQAMGAPKQIALPMVFHAVAATLLCWLFSRFGPVAISFTMLFIVSIRCFISFVVYKNIVGNLARDILRPQLPACISSFTMLTICMLCRQWLLTLNNVSPEMVLFSILVIGCFTYIGTLSLLFPKEGRVFVNEVCSVWTS